jgi:hypothetical protein
MFYALTGSSWSNPNLSVSFMPDGTALDGGRTSALSASLDAQHPTADWQRVFAQVLQTWAQYTPLNFHFVADDGSPQGSLGSAQADPRFGDIRLGAAASSALGSTWFPSTTTRGGDITLSTSYQFAIGSVYDLYSVLLHEAGHALGLDHSADPTAVMSGNIALRVATGLSPDDIAGIQAIYGVRLDDSFDAAARNDSLASATRLSPDASGLIAVAADLTDLADIDHYSITVPTGSDGTLTVSIDARGLSLLAPAVRVYDAAGNLVASASAGAAYGSVATVNLSGLVAGQKYVIVADGASDDAFGMGAYRMHARFGMTVVPNPPPPPPPPPPPDIQPDRYESNNTSSSASDLGRTTGFTQTGLTLHTSADQDCYRFVPAKNGTYAVSSVASPGLNLRLTVFDSGLRMLGSGPAVTLNLTAGQVYYINVADTSGACGGYSLSLAKTTTTTTTSKGSGKGFLKVPHPASNELRLDHSLIDELAALPDANLARPRA